MERKILFNRKTGIANVPDPDKPAPEKEVKVYDNPDKKTFDDEPKKYGATKYICDIKPPDKRTRSERVIEWFGSHELISVNGVCQEASIDTSNFTKLLKAAKIIPDKILDKIEPIIKQYGYE